MDDVGTPSTATGGATGAEEVRLAEVRVDPPHLIGGDAMPVIGTVTLSAPAPLGGADVEIFTDRPEVLVAPAVVHVPEGALSQTFGLVVHAVE